MILRGVGQKWSIKITPSTLTCNHYAHHFVMDAFLQITPKTRRSDFFWDSTRLAHHFFWDSTLSNICFSSYLHLKSVHHDVMGKLVTSESC